MEINELINQAVLSRKQAKTEFVDKKNNIEIWNKYVTSITGFKGDLWDNIISSNGQKDKWDKVQAILYGDKTNPIARGLVQKLKDLGDGENNSGLFTTAWSRMNRGYVNIGIVGPYRQGKSTLLRHLINPISNYVSPSDIIPTREGSEPCTGAPINYINELYGGYNEPVAVVEYYGVNEICDRINGYLVKCGLTNWDNISTDSGPVNKQVLLNYCKKHLNDSNSIEEATAGSYRWTFQMLIQRVNDYVDYLNNSPLPIKLNDKEGKNEFKASSTYWDGNDKQCFRVFATKQINVYVPFKIEGKEVGPIQFLDTPGIGEKRIDVVDGLKKKLQNDIDTVIALEFVPPTGKNEGVDDFHTILAKNYNSGGSNFVYYILNIPKNISLIPLSQAYKNAFKLGIEVPGLDLKLLQKNKLLVNCREDIVYSYIESDESGIEKIEEIPDRHSQTILYEIVENMATCINDIDCSFTNEAIALYNEISSEIVELKNAVSKVLLPNAMVSYDEKIADIMTDLVEELKKVRLTDITETVKSSIIEYASEGMVGRETMKVTGISESDVEEILSSAISSSSEDERFAKLAESMFVKLDKEGPVSRNSYDNDLEFVDYQEYRKKLYASILRDINDRIEEKPVNEAVESNKDRIWKVFMKKEYLGFVASTEDPSVWYEALLKKFEEDRTARSLQEKFSSFYDFRININEIITTIVVDGIIAKYKHSDSFDGSEFNSFKSANLSFIISLLNIESEIKSVLRDRDKEMIEKIRQSVDEKFKNKKNEIITFAPLAKGDYSYANMQNFVRKHYIDILHASGKGDPDKETNSLLENWSAINN